MTETKKPGRFVWHDLMTTDKAGAVRFYTQLFGWKTHDVDMGPAGAYTMIRVGERDIGGIVALDAKLGIPSHIIGYCSVPDVDVATRRAEQLGGKVGVPATNIPEVGRFAIIEDPQGGHIAPFKGTAESPELDGPPKAGEFCWNELLCDDPAKLLPFYKEIFGWSTKSMDMGPMGTYYVLERGDKQSGGVMKKQMKEAPTAWLTYVAVENVDASAKKAESLGAKLLVPGTDIPNIGRFAVLTDPQGGTFAVFQG
jgi:predicted enzyme related to lactoylglutathione lyase